MKRLAVALATLVPLAAHAGGYAAPNVNPRDLAMAGSVVAAQNSAAAVYVNPAALAGLPGLRLSLAGSLLDNRYEWTGQAEFAGASENTNVEPAYPVALFASYGGDFSGVAAQPGETGDAAAERHFGQWGAGFGMTIPAGGNVFWPEDWAGRFRIIEVNRRVYGLYLNGGLQLLPQVRVGGGAVYYRTTEHLTQNINLGSAEVEGEVGTAGGAFSFQVAGEFQPFLSIPLTFGIDYKHQAYQELEGEGHFEGVPPSFATALPEQDVTHVLPMYNQLNTGVAYRPVKPLLVTFAYTLDRFVIYDEDRFVGAAPSPPDIVVERSYENGHTFRLGAEYDVNRRLQVRGGVLRDLAPTNPENLNPSIPDSDVWAFAGGFSYAFRDDLAVHAAYFFANLDEVTAPAGSDLAGTYEGFAQIFSLGVTWRM